jgi:hypothetical protein
MLKSAVEIFTLLVLAGTANAHPGHAALGHELSAQPSDGLVAIVIGLVLLASVRALRSRGLATSRSDGRPPTA